MAFLVGKDKKGGKSSVFIHASRKFGIQTAYPALFSILKNGSVNLIFPEKGVKSYTWILIVILFFGIQNLLAQSIFTNPIAANNINSGTNNPYTTGQTVSSGITVSGIGRGSGTSGQIANGVYRASSWNTVAIDLTAYFEWTITPNSCREIDFVSFVYSSARSNGSISNFAFRSSVDGFTNNIGTPTFNGTTISLSDPAFQNITAPITFRLYAWGADTGGRTFSINDFTFNGTIQTLSPNTAGTISSNTFCINSPLPPGVTQSTTGATGIGTATGLPAGVSVAWASNQITFSGTPTASGSFSYSIPLTGGCGAVNATGTITVTPNNTAGTITSNTFCINSPLPAGVTQSTTGATGIGSPTGLPTGVTAAWAGNQITFSGTPTASGSFTYSIPLTGGCGTVNATGTITITPERTVGAASISPTLCINTPMAQITHATTGVTGIASSSGLPTGVSAAVVGNEIQINGTPSQSGTFNYTITPNGCGSAVATGTITVTPNNTAGTITSNTFCVNSPLPAGVTQSTTGATGIGTATGLPSGVTVSWAGNQITFSGTPTASGSFSYSIPLTGGCGAVNATGTIIINAVQTVGAASATPTLCIGTPLTQITHATTGVTGIATSTGLPTGVTAAVVGNEIRIDGTPTVSGTFNYTITPTSTGCGSAVATGTITVTPNRTVGSPSATPTLCINAPLTLITHSTTGVTGISSSSGLPAGVTAAVVGTEIQITGTPTVSGTFNYIITPIGCGTATATGTITVNPIQTVGTASDTPTLCIDTPLPQITHATTGVTSIATSTGLPSGVTAAVVGNEIRITGTPTVSGIFNYTITPTSNGCGSPVATGTITVTPNRTVGAASSTPTLCIDSPLTQITHATTGVTGIATSVGLPAGVTAALVGNEIQITGTPTVSGTFNYTITPTGCGSAVATGTITVTPNRTVGAASASPTLCINTPLTTITHATTGVTGIVSSTGLPTGVTATVVSNEIRISGTPTVSGTFNYTITPDGCGSAVATGTITVIPDRTVGAASSTPTLCINTPLTQITHTTTGVTSIVTSTGLPTGVTAAVVGNEIRITGTPTVSGTFNYTITPNGCGSAVATGTITVTPNRTVGPASSTPTLCINSPLTQITHVTTGVTGIISSTGLPPGVAATVVGNEIRITGTPTASGTFNYTITPNGCGSAVATGTIIVDPLPTADAGTSLFSICQGQTSAPMDGSVGGSATGGVWSGGAGTWTNANDPALATYTASPTESGNIQLTLTTTGGSCAPVQVTKFITVNANPIINVGPAIPAICQGQTTIAMGGSVSGGATTGTWSGGAGTWTNANNPALATYTASATESGTITLTLTASNGTCVASSTKTITVNPNPVVNVGPALAAICQGQQSAAMGGSVTSGASALWSGGAGTWTNANNASTARYTASATESGVITLTLTSTLGSCTVTSTKTITVNPNPTASAGPAFTSPICQGQPSPAMGGSVGPGGATGLWSGGAGTWTNANNPATATYTPATSESGTITLTLTATLGSCTTVVTKTITVNPLPTVTATPASQFRCDNIASGTIITLSPAPLNLAGTTYEWTRTNPAGLVGTGAGTALSGTTTGTTLVGTFRNNTTANITTTYTITPVGPAPTFCRGVPVNVTVTVYAPQVAPVISADQAVCAGETPSLLSGTAATGGSNTYTYQWQRRTTATGWTAADNIAGATGLTYQPPTVNFGDPTLYYRLVAADLCGTVVSNVISIESITSFGTIGNTTLSNLPPATPFCPGGTFSNSGSQIRVSTANHAFFLEFRYRLNYDPNFITPATTADITGSSSSSGFLVRTTTANLPQFTVSNTTNTTVTTTIEVIPFAFFNGAERCNVASVSFPITIRPTPVLTATPTSPTICSGSSTAITLSSNITDNPTTYTWTASLQSGTATGFSNQTTPASGPINQTLTNTGTGNAVVRYVITPSSMGCTGASRTVDITVLPSNTITRTSAAATTSQTLCSGASITPITYSTTGATGATVSGLPAGVTGVWSGNVLTISGTPNVPAGGTFNYTVTMTGGCTFSQAAPTGTITVLPVHTVTAGANRTVCRNASMTAISMTLGGGATGATVTGLPTGVNFNVSGTTLTISGIPTVSGSFTYTVTTTGNACAVATTGGTITVDPPHTITAGSSQTVCQNAPIADIILTLGNGATGATVTGLPAGVSASVSGTTLTISGFPTATGSFTYSVTTTGNSCTVATTGGIITVTPNHAITAGSNRTVCQNTSMSAITMTLAGGATGATVSGLPTGVTSNVSGTTLTISGIPTDSGTFPYTVTTTGNSCSVAITGGIITVDPIHSITAGSSQTVCQNAPITAINMTLGGGATGATVTGLPSGVTSSVSGTTLTISGTPSVSGIFNYTVTTTGNGCTIATTGGTITVNPIHTISTGSSPTVCQNAPMTPITLTLGGGATGATVSGLPTGVTSDVSGTTLTISGTPTATGSFTYSVTTTGNSCTVATTGGTITVSPIHSITAGSSQTVCQNAPITSINMTLGGGATDATVTGLPSGVTSSVSGTTLTISGTPSVSGIFNYTVTTTGNGCTPATTSGTITVDNPSYPITNIEVTNPAAGSPPYTSTFTVYSGGFTPGTYTVVYNSTGVNPATNQSTTATVSASGVLTFNSQPYSNEGTSILEIVSIRNNAGNCTYFPPNNTSALYGVNCSTEYTQAIGNEIFYVPAGISQITLQAFGSATSSPAETLTVVPGGAIFIIFESGNIFATEVPGSTDPADAIVLATGTNGRVVISFSCSAVPPCSTQLDNGGNYLDSEGFTVLRFSTEGPCTWVAPEGLEEFEVLVVGAGGGGGYGPSAGGGGGGEVIYRQYTSINMGGEIGLRNASFTLSIGARGRGANPGERGLSGSATSFSGPAFDYTGSNTFIPLTAEGGGGGGSTDSNLAFRQGASGSGNASGGGGAAFLTNAASGGGSAGSGNAGGNAFTDSFGSAGAGGGGVNGPGSNGSSSGGGAQMNGGNGGSGFSSNISGVATIYGAGGGGTSSGAISNIEGRGGSQYTVNSVTYFAGGSATNSGVGQSATTFGSGGGAGASRGGDGFPGVVYIRYPNFRILPLEYLYFNVKHNPTLRSGDLTWATAKEWENDRFDIERSVNDVKSWETIGMVQGAGYSDKPVDYAYQDLKLPLSGGTIFYRLKQFDFDGEYTYSDTKAIQIEPISGLTYWRIYPNPTTGDPINLEMLDTGAYNDEQIAVRVIAATGQFDVLEGENPRELSLRLSDILRTKAAGVYTIEISWGANKEYHKIILKR